jgi:uncharacterized protein YecT (DUF1311 family)
MGVRGSASSVIAIAAFLPALAAAAPSARRIESDRARCIGETNGGDAPMRECDGEAAEAMRERLGEVLGQIDHRLRDLGKPRAAALLTEAQSRWAAFREARQAFDWDTDPNQGGTAQRLGAAEAAYEGLRTRTEALERFLAELRTAGSPAVDPAVVRCAADAGGGDPAIDACLAAALRAADARLNDVYRRLLARLRAGERPDLADALRQVERSWLTYRDAEVAFVEEGTPGPATARKRASAVASLRLLEAQLRELEWGLRVIEIESSQP